MTNSQLEVNLSDELSDNRFGCCVHRTSFLRRDSSALIVESTARLTCLDLSRFLGAVKKGKKFVSV